MRWFEKYGVLDYVVECYAGVEGSRRQFIWEQECGDIVIGNTRAFYDHLATKFDLSKKAHAWMELHVMLHELGEVVRQHQAHRLTGEKIGKFRNQEPKWRVIKRRS